MKIKPFSEKQLLALTWWCKESIYKDYDGVICDGAVRSGKTFCMSLSFIAWSFFRFEDSSFAICGKTIRSVRRNVIVPIIPVLKDLGFGVKEKVSSNLITITYQNRVNRFYLFGGNDESSASLIQGITLSGVLLDEVALMPRSFVEQAIARCSVNGSTYWFNCNPEHPQHWFYKEWILKANKKNVFHIHFLMDDNPSLSKKMLKRYKSLYSGVFYSRFIAGKWVAIHGAVYPFMSNKKLFVNVPESFYDYVISCDYGTVNPSSFGLWGKHNNTWYRIDEYYYNSRKTGEQKTDEEHYESLCNLAGNRKISSIVVDPSAASFIEVIKRHNRFRVRAANNNVLDGIRRVSTALKQGEIKICKNCTDSMKEFSLYRWDSKKNIDAPIKENDHAMDDIRYFVTTILDGSEDGIFALAARR